jgi:hypothetical protein
MNKRKAIWSLVWGILSVVIWPLSIIFGPIALAMGIDVLRKKKDGRGMAIAGIVTGSVGLLILVVFVLLAYFGAIGPDFARHTEPVVVADTGFILKAGDSHRFTSFAGGTYDFEIASTDGVTIIAYPSEKDFQLDEANGQGWEYYEDCSAEKSTRFHKTCTLPPNAVLAVRNPNVFQESNVNVRIVQVS